MYSIWGTETFPLMTIKEPSALWIEDKCHFQIFIQVFIGSSSWDFNVYYKLLLAQIGALHRTSSKPQPEPMITEFHNAKSLNSASMSEQSSLRI